MLNLLEGSNPSLSAAERDVPLCTGETGAGPSGEAVRGSTWKWVRIPPSPRMEAVKLALVGVGRMGRVHAEALTDVPEVDVVALVDPAADGRETAAVHHPDAAQLHDVEGLAATGAEAVLVASPTPHHPSVTEWALEAGLHVLCEKPLALDPPESDRLGNLATHFGRVLQVGFWRRFAPPWAASAEAIAAGRIGAPVMLRLSQWDADPPPPEFCDPATSGGLAIDCGVHEFDLAEWMTGQRVTAVRSSALPVVEESLAAVGDLDNLLIVGHLESGGRIVVDLSRNARYADDVRTEILGSDGAILIDLLPSGHARIGTSEGMTELAGSTADDAMREGLIAQARTFAAAVRGEKVAYPTAFSSSAAVRIARASMRSLVSGFTEAV